jgi:hypothetical protein
MNKALIYIAGALRSDIPGYISNMRKMILTAEEVRLQGYAVFIPCLDFLTGLTAGGYEFHDYFDNSFEILKRCDAIFLVPGWETSKGTAREIELAKSIGIPVFDNINDLVRAFSQNQ